MVGPDGTDRSEVLDLARGVLPTLAKHAAEVDDAACFPVESVAVLRQSGLLGLLVPRAHGGLGGDLRDLVSVAFVLASGCLSTAMIWAMHCQQVDSVVRFGSTDLRAELLARIGRGEVYLASVTTEPATGGSVLTAHAALQDGPQDLLVGRQAPVVTGGAYADGFLVTMRDTVESSENRVTLVYADRDQLDIDLSGDWNPLGMRGTHSVGLRLTGRIPVHQVVGGRGEFRTVAIESMVPAAHLGWAACWLGAAHAAFTDVIGLVRSARRPKSIDPNSPLFAERLARARNDLELAHAYLAPVLAEVVRYRSDGRSLDVPSVQIHLNTLKVVTAELTFRAVDRLVQLTGMATGYLKDAPIPLERHLRDLRSASLNQSNDRLLTAIGALSLLDRAAVMADCLPTQPGARTR
jgi:acyl-CoA dehydrogenase